MVRKAPCKVVKLLRETARLARIASANRAADVVILQASETRFLIKRLVYAGKVMAQSRRMRPRRLTRFGQEVVQTAARTAAPLRSRFA